MSYIQDKLDAFDKKFTDTEQGNFYSANTTWKHTIGVPVHVKMFLEQSLTDYHNHIVEKIKNELGDFAHTRYLGCNREDGKDNYCYENEVVYIVEDYFKLLQDTKYE